MHAHLCRGISGLGAVLPTLLLCILALGAVARCSLNMDGVHDFWMQVQSSNSGRCQIMCMGIRVVHSSLWCCEASSTTLQACVLPDLAKKQGWLPRLPCCSAAGPSTHTAALEHNDGVGGWSLEKHLCFTSCGGLGSIAA